MTRREFLTTAWAAVVTMIAAVAGGIGLWHSTPPEKASARTVFELSPPPAAPVEIPGGKFAWMQGEKGAAAISEVCPHMGCVLSWHVQPPPAQTLAQRYLPEEGVGKLDRLSWEALPAGDFCTDAQQPDAGTPFASVWADFSRDLTQTNLSHARGCILIQPAQPDLKRIQVYITYEDAGAAAAVLNEAYRHNEGGSGP